MAYKHNSTLCWECEWAGGKDGKCPWAREFKPVEGWKAKPTKIRCRDHEAGYIDSFDVYECPLFELAEEIKKGIVKNAGRVRKTNRISKEVLQEEILRLRESGMSYEKIGDMIGYDKRQVWRIYKKLKESEENGKEI